MVMDYVLNVCIMPYKIIVNYVTNFIAIRITEKKKLW